MVLRFDRKKAIAAYSVPMDQCNVHRSNANGIKPICLGLGLYSEETL